MKLEDLIKKSFLEYFNPVIVGTNIENWDKTYWKMFQYIIRRLVILEYEENRKKKTNVN